MLREIQKKVLSGERLTGGDALELFNTDDIFALGRLASYAAHKKNGHKVFYIINRHINPTNICVNRCRFCAFSRSKGQKGAFELTTGEILERLKGGRYKEVHIVGGLHPRWPFEHYLGMISEVKKNFPLIHIKAFTAVEVDYMQRMSGMSLEEVLTLLKENGLGSMPGGGAEIFDEDVRARLCPEKITGKRWLEVMETAHRAGIKSNATMLYGHIEDYKHRVEHLLKLRELQDETGGFQAFIPLAYHPENTSIRGFPSSGLDDLRTIAASRLVLDNFPHIKAYWVMLGEKISQLALMFGADDMDGTIVEEKITHSAGAKTKQGLTKGELVHLIRKAGKMPVERDSFYNEV